MRTGITAHFLVRRMGQSDAGVDGSITSMRAPDIFMIWGNSLITTHTGRNAVG